MRAILPALLCALLVGSPDAAGAQRLKLSSLNPVPTQVVGPWVTYRVRTRTFRRPVHEYTQRIAIVARERWEKWDGVWIELKTVDPTAGTRIERGFFAEGTTGGAEEGFDTAAGEDPSTADRGAGRPRLRLLRYQVLAAGGKLYEYQPHTELALRAGGEVASLELFEFDASQSARLERLGPDTLTLGRRVVPAIVELRRRDGDESWTTQDDSLHVKHVVLSQALWRNPAVPITGLARSLLIARWERAPVLRPWSAARLYDEPDSAPPQPEDRLDPHAPLGAVPPLDRETPTPDTASADSAGGSGESTAAPHGTQPAAIDSTGLAIPYDDPAVLSWTELTLVDLGADAVPEVTLEPEPPPGIEEDETPQGLVR